MARPRVCAKLWRWTIGGASLRSLISPLLTNPLRLAVDIKNVHQSIRPLTHSDGHIIINVNESGIERIRIGQMGRNVRGVFDLATRQRYQIGMIGTRLFVWFGAQPGARFT